jgi:hypothetical protein
LSKGNSGENSPNSGTNSNTSLGRGNNDSSTDSEWHTGRINGNTFRNKEVKYKIINGMAIFEGDIILARTPQELEKLSPEPKVPSEHQPTVKPIVKAVARAGDEFRWPRGEIPYIIQSTLPNQQRVTAAMKHWEERTPIRFIQRTQFNAQYYPNYVSFIQYVPQLNEKQEEVFHCSSPIGMQGLGEQSVVLSDQCVTGDAIHEIGHTVGLWHEQSREDRDNFIRIVWDNVDPRYIHNFNQHIVDGDDIGEYDYCSIMHYGAWFFTRNPGQPTIEVLQPGRPCGNANSLGQKNGLSNGDIAAATDMYGNLTPTIVQNADGRLEVFVIGSDNQIYHRWQTAANSNTWSVYTVGGQTYDWTPLGLGQQFFSSGQRPAIVKNSNGRLDVFWLSDYNLQHMYKEATPNSSWSNTGVWEIGGGDFDGDPVVARNSNGRLEVFMVHEEYTYNMYRLHHFGGEDTSFLPSLGGQWSANRRPAVAQNADGRLEVFMVSLDNQIYHRWQTAANSNTWSVFTEDNPDGSKRTYEWVSLGPTDRSSRGLAAGDPVVARDVDGRLNVFVVQMTTRELWYRWQTTSSNSNQWSDGWNNLEGHWSPRRIPAIAQNADGRLEVFMVGSDQRLHHRWQTSRNSTTGIWDWYRQWDPFGKQQWPLSSNPAVARNADGRLEVFMVGSDGQFYHTWQTSPNNSSQWSGSWARL